jgi:hypothetical protein
MNRKRICVALTTQRMDFWLSVAAVLHENFDIVIVASSQFKPIVEKKIPGVVAAFETEEIYLSPDPPSDPKGVVNQALDIEREYDITMTLLMSNTRDLGKGYVFNADRHPDMVSSWWSHEHKVAEIVARVRLWEQILDRHKPVLVLNEMNSLLVSCLAGKRGIRDLGLGFMKLGNRYFWTENCHYQNHAYYRRISELVASADIGERDFPAVEYQEVQATKYLDSKVDNGFLRAFKDAGLRVVRETKHRIRRGVLRSVGRPLPKVPGYRYLGWLPVELRRPFMSRYMLIHGRRPEQLEGYKLVYVPMHLEPEIALMAVSPEFNNTMELVTLLSKSLPADYMIVLKENINALGVRSRRYYDHLRRISNVVFADLRVSSWEWIKRSDFTVTISGTAAIEAVYFLKPVLSYGAHQVVNLLPSVRYASNYETTQRAVRELQQIAGDDSLLKASRAALHQAQVESSFEMDNSETLYDGGRVAEQLAHVAVASLYQQYGHELGVQPGKQANS